jgi:putative ABC transport system permease protein
MFKSNLLTAIRHISKNKGLTAINIFGLSISIAICLLSYLFVSFEYSHNDSYKDADKVFMLLNKINYKHSGLEYDFMHNKKIAAELKESIPEIEYATGLRTCVGWTSYNEKNLFRNIAFVDKSFFKIYDLDFLIGKYDSKTWSINNVIISKKYADNILKAYSFNEYSELIGQTIEFADLGKKSLTISGILKSIPKNSTISFDIAIDYEHAEHYGYNGSADRNTNVYVKLYNKEDKKEIEEKSHLLNKTIYAEKYNYLVENDYIDDDNDNLSINLVNIKDTYFSDKIAWQSYTKKGNKTRSTTLIYISLLVLFIACINYIMLSIGISMKRFNEIAIKKVFGSNRRRVILQFITEVSITVFISIILGIVIAELTLPLFKEFTGYEIDYKLYTNPNAYLFLLFTSGIIISIISIPSIYISRLNPIKVFRNQSKLGSKLAVAKSFMIIQIVLSLTLIIGSIFVVKHISYMKNHEVGFDTKDLISINLPSTYTNEKANIIANKFQQLNGVTSVGGSDRGFTWGTADFSILYNSEKLLIRAIGIDTSYIKTVGMNLISGRNLRETDNKKAPYCMIVNEAFVKKLGLSHPVGTQIKAWGSYIEIVGIIKDFNYSSMRNKIESFCFMNNVMGSTKVLHCRLKPESSKRTITEMKNMWADIESEREFSYVNVEDALKTMYSAEEKLARMIFTVSTIALLISILGLIGLTMLLLNQKIKEIGIRKINGASATDILIMINKEFAKYLLIASLVAIPLSYYGLRTWLEDFAYKTPLSWWVFAACTFALAIIVVLTISYKSFKAAMSNPVIAIKHE